MDQHTADFINDMDRCFGAESCYSEYWVNVYLTIMNIIL